MRKKLFAVIMSAMMMITFMPSMAFAADTVVWGDKCATLTVNGASYAVARVWNPADGSITANVDTTAYEPGTTLPDVTRTFYDLDSAVIEPTYSTMTTAKFVELFGEPATAAAKTAVKVQLTAPNYCSNYDGLSAGAKVKTGVTLAGVASLTVDTPVYDVEKQFENQTFTIKATATPVLDATAVVYGGAKLTKTFTVQPTLPANAGEVAVLIDGKTALNQSGAELFGYVDYDAAEHTVAIQKAPGFTATYQVWNAEKGLWEDVDTIKATNAGDVDAKVTIKSTTNVADVADYRIHFSVDASEMYFSFDETAMLANLGNDFYFEVSDDYKAADYVKAYGDLYNENTSDPEEIAFNKACKAAVKANQELLMEYFNDFYEFDTHEGYFGSGSGATKATVTKIKAKDLTALTLAEKDALVAKYSTLFANFDRDENGPLTRNNVTSTLLEAELGDEAYFVVVPNTKDNDVDFLDGVTKKVHIKNATKIKSAKKVTIKAESESGVAPTFKKLSGNSKIKVAENGKVTLKKGLKKGTYSVRVKATVKAGKGFKSAKAYRTYKFKVVK